MNSIIAKYLLIKKKKKTRFRDPPGRGGVSLVSTHTAVSTGRRRNHKEYVINEGKDGGIRRWRGGVAVVLQCLSVLR